LGWGGVQNLAGMPSSLSSPAPARVAIGTALFVDPRNPKTRSARASPDIYSAMKVERVTDLIGALELPGDQPKTRAVPLIFCRKSGVQCDTGLPARPSNVLIQDLRYRQGMAFSLLQPPARNSPRVPRRGNHRRIGRVRPSGPSNWGSFATRMGSRSLSISSSSIRSARISPGRHRPDRHLSAKWSMASLHSPQQFPAAMQLLTGAIILGHNVRFDLSFLAREFRKCGRGNRAGSRQCTRP